MVRVVTWAERFQVICEWIGSGLFGIRITVLSVCLLCLMSHVVDMRNEILQDGCGFECCYC